MNDKLSRSESLILDLLSTDPETVHSLEDVVAQLPELCWSELFGAVDRLSRRGAIRMHRKGFTYLLVSSDHAAACAGSR